MNKVLSTIGLCRAAGKLIFGFDQVCDEISKPKNKVAGILLAKDISEKTAKEVHFNANKHNVLVETVDVTMDEIKQLLNKRTGIFAVLDEGFFNTITKKP